MREFDYQNLDQSVFSVDTINLLTKIHEYKGKQELYIEAEPDILESMLEIAKIQSTESSNRIEGIYTSDKRLREIVLDKAEPRNRSEEEIAGYREVLKLIHDNYDFMELTPNVLLQLHRDLYAFTGASIAGRFKNSDNTIEEVDSQGNRRIRFQPVSAFETPDSISALCSSFQKAVNQTNVDPLILIPIFILDFLCIHPFNDGNGRMSRLLTLLLLYKSGYIVGKYISIEQIIEKTKESYYDVLQECSRGWHEEENTYAPFLGYYLGIILKAYREFTSRVEHLRHRTLTKADRIKKVVDGKIGKFTKADIATQCPDISIAMIELTLSNLLAENKIEKIGTGRNTAYVRTPKA
jgi:Fic family protein